MMFTCMTSTCKDHALHPLYTLCFTCAICKSLKKCNCLESLSVYLGNTNLNRYCSCFFWVRSCFGFGSNPFLQKGAFDFDLPSYGASPFSRLQIKSQVEANTHPTLRRTAIKSQRLLKQAEIKIKSRHP